MNCIYLKVCDALGLTFKVPRSIIVQLDKEKKKKITQRESSTQYDEKVCLYLPLHFYPSPIFVRGPEPCPSGALHSKGRVPYLLTILE